MVPHQPTKCADLGEGLQHWEDLNHTHCPGLGRSPLGTCDVPALRRFQLQVEFPKALKYLPQMLQVFFLHVPKNYYIIKIDDAISQVQLT